MDESKHHPKYQVVTDKEDIIAVLKDLLAKFERGELECAALRVFREDGTWEDVMIGGSEEQRARMLADLQASKTRAN
jgi:hypothetical protein